MHFLPDALAPLAAYRQFIVCQFVPDYAHPGKTFKYPLHPVTGHRHDAHDPSIWVDAATAIAVATAWGLTPDANGVHYGVGFTFTEADPFFFIDVDGCAILDQEGKFLAWTPIVNELCGQLTGAAVEISQSGRGLHIIGTGSAPEKRRKKDLTSKLFDLYTEKRFVALTGTGIIGNAATTHSPALFAITEKHLRLAESDGTAPTEWTTEPVPEWRGPTDDDELIHWMLHARISAQSAFGNVATITDLWDCNIDALSRAFPPDPNGTLPYDASEADASLAQRLMFWTGKNCERIKRLMLRSGMVRDKWLDRDSYLETTILMCLPRPSHILQTKPVLMEKQTGEIRTPVAITYKSFSTAAELPQIFEGCFYVQDNNAALLPNGDIVDQSRFKARYAGRNFCMDISGDKSTQDAWDCFINNQSVHFPRVEGTCFRPDLPYQAVVTREGRDWVNVYKAPEIDRAPGDVTPFLNLLKKLLPNGDDSVILLSYMAAIVQHVGVKFKWSVFLQGTEGNGKSTIVRCLRHALGYKYIFNLKAPMIDGNFNGWLEGNILYVADDIYTVSDRGNLIEALQSLITEEEQPITYKGIDSVQKRVCGNFFFTDNHRDALKKTEAGRRICTLYCAQQDKRKRDKDGLTARWFAEVYYPWLENGGYAAVAEYLHALTIDPRYNPAGGCKDAPETSATLEAIEDGRTGVEQDIGEWIDLQEPGFCGDFISVSMLKQRLDKPMGTLKIKETLGRLGYEMHRALPKGRTLDEVLPDGTRPVLYVRIDSAAAELTDPVAVAGLYSQWQNSALSRRLLQGVKNG